MTEHYPWRFRLWRFAIERKVWPRGTYPAGIYTMDGSHWLRLVGRVYWRTRI